MWAATIHSSMVSSFQQLTGNMLIIKFYQCLDSKCGSLVSLVSTPLKLKHNQCTNGSFFKKNYTKNCWHQPDSNSNRQSRRQALWPLDHHYHGQVNSSFTLLSCHPMTTCLDWSVAFEIKMIPGICRSKERTASSPASPTSVTRNGDLLDFGQLFKAFGNY